MSLAVSAYESTTVSFFVKQSDALRAVAHTIRFS